jgi:hypothetical protein
MFTMCPTIEPGLRRDGVGVDLDDLVVRFRIDRQRHDAIHHAVSPSLELEHVEHGAVVLLGHDGFVARIPVVAVDHRIERLGGVARDDELFGADAGHLREASTDTQLVVGLARAHVARRLDVDAPHVADERLEHGLGLHAVVAVLEVDVLGRELVLAADGAPEGFVLGELEVRHGHVAREHGRTEH